MNAILKVNQLIKSFKGHLVLNGLNFEIHQGEVLCLLGPNGAGKSTTINILSSILPYDGGEVLYHGKPIRDCLRAYKSHIGIVPQEISLYEELSPEQNLNFFASLYGIDRKKRDESVEKALKFAGLENRRKDAVKTFSGGMKRRLNIACAIIHKPELVIMDEPTVGIDAQSRNYILQSINELCKQGMTVLYTTHYMEEVEAISTRVIIIDHGEIIAESSKESLKNNFQDKTIYEVTVDHAEQLQPEDFDGIGSLRSPSIEDGKISATVMDNSDDVDEMISILRDKKIRIKSISHSQTNLEAVFLSLTGRKLRD